MALADYLSMSDDELASLIVEEKKKKGIVILAHNYQRIEIQKLADYIGDSLELSRIAAKLPARTIVFAGVMFMAETAKILAPEKRILIPDERAGCPLAESITANQLRELRSKYPDRLVVSYVNTTAEIKALSDIVCTSANAVKVVEHLGGKKIIFVPDKNLGDWVKKCTGADMIIWQGSCYVHEQFTVEDVKRAKELHPDAAVLIHPEASPDVVAFADLVASTSGMYKFAKEKRTPAIIGTEVGLMERIRHEIQDSKVYPLKRDAICKTMKYTTLPKLARSVREGFFEVTVPDDIREKAFSAVRRMTEIV